VLEELRRRQLAHEPLKQRYFHETSALRELLLRELPRARDAWMEGLFGQWPSTAAVAPVMRELQAYARRCDWGLLDVTALAAALPSLDPDALARFMAPRLALYQAFRMTDDALDEHLDYKGQLRTALGTLVDGGMPLSAARATQILGALMMAMQSCAELSPPERELGLRTVWGALAESVPQEPWSLAQYREMVRGKMGCYSMLLYGPLANRLAPAEGEGGALHAFLERTFYVSQVINDLGDRDDDRARGQPNFWNLGLDAQAQQAEFQAELDALESGCRGFDGALGGYAHSRMADLLRYTLDVAEQASARASR